MTREDLFDGIGDFTQAGARLGRFHRQFEQVAVFARFRGARNGFQNLFDAGVIAVVAQFLEPLDLRGAHGGVVDGQDVDRVFMFEPVFIDADDRLGARVDTRLTPRCRFLDTHLRQSGFDGLGHAAETFDFDDVPPGPFA